jgi:AcrR family transcriptional regulator
MLAASSGTGWNVDRCYASGAPKPLYGRHIVTRGMSTTRTPRRQRRERGSISAAEIVNGAYALAAEITVEKLSMPALARRLDVGVTSIYWYFHSKDELLEAMRERALEQYQIALPFTGEGEWHELLRHHFHTMRNLFRDNPVLCDLVIMHTLGYGDVPNRVTFERLEAIIATLVQAGFTPADALDTYFSLAAHSRGFAMLERRESLQAAASPRTSEPTARPLDRETMPILTQLAKDRHTFSLIQDRVFEAGLDALIERAKRVLASTAGKPRR